MEREVWEIPRWLLDRLADEFNKEMAERMEEDGPQISLYFFGSDIRATLYSDGDYKRQMGHEQKTLEEIFSEPFFWVAKDAQGNVSADAEHYKLIGEIADKIEAQAKRIRALHNSLSVRDDNA
jgi:hypothetical protein